MISLRYILPNSAYLSVSNLLLHALVFFFFSVFYILKNEQPHLSLVSERLRNFV